MKNYRRRVYALIAAAAVNLIVMLSLIPGLPEKVPCHFNYEFIVDGMGSRWFMALCPAITLAFAVSIAVELKIRGYSYANTKPLTIFAVVFEAFFIALGWMLFAMCGTGAQLGDRVKMPLDLLMNLGMSILFIVLGNYLPTVQPNRTFGIKMKKTLNNEEIWRRTHRFGGPVFVCAGIFSAVCGLIGYFGNIAWLSFAGLVGGIFGAIVIIMIYAAKQAE